MRGDIVYQELIQLDFEADNTDQVFEYMATKLQNLGMVSTDFLEALKDREREYPTALNIEPYAVAIPHTDPECIIRPFIALIRLKNPVKWRDMTGTDITCDVKFVFMLGFKNVEEDSNSETHIELLQILVQNLQNRELVNKLNLAKSIEEYRDLILSMKVLED